MTDRIEAEVQRFVAEHEAAQSDLVREHLREARAGGFPAGTLCLSAASVLGAPGPVAEAAGRTVALVEAAAAALRELVAEQDNGAVARSHGLPLALNSADALYSLAHVSLMDLLSLELRHRGEVARRTDELSEAVWEAAQVNGEHGFSDPAMVRAALSRTAGELAALAAGRGEAAAAALGIAFAGRDDDRLTDEFAGSEVEQLKALL